MAKVKTKNSRQVSGNISLQVWYRKELLKQVQKMAEKTEKEVLKVWKQNTPKMTLEAEQAEGTALANDSSPAASLTKVLNSLRYYFGTHFQTMADRVSRKFVKMAEKGASVSLKSILKEEGFTVDFRLTRELNDILQATIAENVSLIKSIHTAYYEQVQTIVMQAVKNGRDMDYIKSELMERFRITERKAQIIARDQTNKATQAISRARALETGITTARWVHIPGAKTSREEHKAFDGKPFDIREGLYDPKAKKYVLPGELINCNCRFRLVVPSTEK